MFLFVGGDFSRSAEVEGSLGILVNSSYREGGEEGRIMGPALGVCGYFPVGPYFLLGLTGFLESYRVTMVDSSTIQDVQGTNFSFGPLVGVRFGILSLWTGYLLVDNLIQTHRGRATLLEGSGTKSGTGIAVGSRLNLNQNFGLGATYLFHRYSTYTQAAPSEEAGVSSLRIENIFIHLSFSMDMW